MEKSELIALFKRLIAESGEHEWLEFKESYYEPEQVGRYLSGLANAASYHSKQHGYIVFGVADKSHEVVGTSFNPEKKRIGNQPLLIWLSSLLENNVGFDHYFLNYESKKIVIITIRAAFGQPVKFKGKSYIRIGECLTELSHFPDRERRIWQHHTDWSAQICERASIDDLESEAIEKARKEYVKKYPLMKSEIIQWDNVTFLNKAKIIIQGAITNTAVLLLGKPESSTLLSPAVARISWILKDEHNQEMDYNHYDPPFLLNVDNILAKIRNLTFRALPSGTLFPVEIPQYDPWVLREALHNCIAHQDYGMRGRIIIAEFPDKLVFTNMGSFIPGSVENVIHQDAPQSIYRNSFLAEAMVNLNMIDTQGGGIKRMFNIQAKRYFPLPGYDLSKQETVVVTINGTILDERYSRLLMESVDLDLWTVILLDKIQKRVHISSRDYRKLRKRKLVEGRYPNIYVAAQIAAVTGEEARHIRNRGLDSQYYQDLIYELIKEHQPVGRDKIDELIMDKLPEILSTDQKKTKIHNMLTKMSIKEESIENTGSRRYPQWKIKKNT